MLFTSPEFILFLAVSFAGYYVIPAGWRRLYLLAVSYIYYFTWSISSSLLLFGATLLAYVAGIQISRSPNEKSQQRLVWLAVACLVAVLAGFKYLGAISGTFMPLFGGRHSAGPHFLESLIIPVGISYYTFKLISYVVDVYWEKLPAERDFTAFASYAAFFPQILSGPIQRSSDYLSQIHSQRAVSYEMMTAGCRLLLFGYFKKLVIADRLAIFVDTVYKTPQTYNSLTLLIAVYAYVFQLYADFSGLTDIARGSARLFGIHSPKNFDAPFFAPNIQVYWRKWHMSLTSWLTDYVFIPLRMTLRNLGNQTSLILAIFINMVLIGVWHGARWTFLWFGVLHGIFMVVSALTLKPRDRFFRDHPRLAAWRPWTAPLGMFQLVAFASIFFRSETVTQAMSMVTHLFAFNMNKVGATFFPKKDVLIAIAGIVLMEGIHYLESRGAIRKTFLVRPPAIRWAVYYTMAFALLLFGQFASRGFIYFEF